MGLPNHSEEPQTKSLEEIAEEEQAKEESTDEKTDE